MIASYPTTTVVISKEGEGGEGGSPRLALAAEGLTPHRKSPSNPHRPIAVNLRTLNMISYMIYGVI